MPFTCIDVNLALVDWPAGGRHRQFPRRGSSAARMASQTPVRGIRSRRSCPPRSTKGLFAPIAPPASIPDLGDRKSIGRAGGEGLSAGAAVAKLTVVGDHGGQSTREVGAVGTPFVWWQVTTDIEFGEPVCNGQQHPGNRSRS